MVQEVGLRFIFMEPLCLMQSQFLFLSVAQSPLLRKITILHIIHGFIVSLIQKISHALITPYFSSHHRHQSTRAATHAPQVSSTHVPSVPCWTPIVGESGDGITVQKLVGWGPRLTLDSGTQVLTGTVREGLPLRGSDAETRVEATVEDSRG